ncbi:conserved hypothetical protein [Synechococcus sp. CC9902]|uniref:hypothetical protein n=1 Tax=Synechococcus sp. (strain CC9902) TaxID=316279 RepID=UPI00005D4363|nr:hypothetical protein [Synechococcus sp. CC9902]ABB26721.1 conserved hypothetical protein [Synechococcus sp. CC9902]
MVQRLTWLVPLVLLQGCAGTPLAERLETSFGAAETGVETQPARSDLVTTTGLKIKDSASPAAVRPDLSNPDGVLKEGTATSTASEPSVALETSTPSEESPLNPTAANSIQPNPPRSNQPQEPYRITIRLSGADPAAPAEAVTRVLRNADVSFAVERIERIQP